VGQDPKFGCRAKILEAIDGIFWCEIGSIGRVVQNAGRTGTNHASGREFAELLWTDQRA
jgi:hypothetical protein